MLIECVWNCLIKRVRQARTRSRTTTPEPQQSIQWAFPSCRARPAMMGKASSALASDCLRSCGLSSSRKKNAALTLKPSYIKSQPERGTLSWWGDGAGEWMGQGDSSQAVGGSIGRYHSH